MQAGNCYFPGKPNERTKPGMNEVLVDPLFMDSKKGDFRLKDGSPCRGKGTDVGMGKSPDLGAFVK